MNAFYARFETVLLVVISDVWRHVKELAWIRFKKARAEQCEHAADQHAVIRMFVVPDLNQECDDYTNMVKWSKVVTEPPITRTFPDKIIQKNMESRECSIL